MSSRGWIFQTFESYNKFKNPGCEKQPGFFISHQAFQHFAFQYLRKFYRPRFQPWEKKIQGI